MCEIEKMRERFRQIDRRGRERERRRKTESEGKTIMESDGQSK